MIREESGVNKIQTFLCVAPEGEGLWQSSTILGELQLNLELYHGMAGKELPFPI